MNPEPFNLVVIGGGPAGICGANTAAMFGHRVAMIEKEPMIGGAGINTGTIPSKTLRETALALSGWKSRKLFGVDLSLRREATIEDFTHSERQVTAGERKEIESRLDRCGVVPFQGQASFVDAHTLKVVRPDGRELHLTGEKILIATGSSPRRPAEFPFDDERVFDSDQLLRIKTLPRRLVVIGAGVIGAEYACTFAAMGVEVHLVDGRDELLGFLDREVSQGLLVAMQGNGIHFHWNERVTKCDTSQPGDLQLTLTSGTQLACDRMLVCAGRTSNTGDLNLAAAGITPSQRGQIAVDNAYASEVPHIYAAGDVIGSPALAATSMEQARIAMCHAFDVKLKLGLTPLLATGIYTIPEASMVGEAEEALQEQGIDYVVGKARYADNARGRIMGDEAGFLKLLFRRADMKLLGVHVLGEQATELVHIGLMAMLAEETADIFNRACFNYPTLGDLYKYATYDALLRRANIAGEGWCGD
jgi:NAD(P) transhydrogenase